MSAAPSASARSRRWGGARKSPIGTICRPETTCKRKAPKSASSSSASRDQSGLKRHSAVSPRWRDLAQQQFHIGQAHALLGARAAVIDLEGDEEGQNVEAVEAGDGPGTEDDEGDARNHGRDAAKRHHQAKPFSLERAMRLERGLEDGLVGTRGHLRLRLASCASSPCYIASMRARTIKRPTGEAHKAATGKSRRKRRAKLTPTEIETIFARFAALNPEPETELIHSNIFTLLVAVVLSAQATDAGVNKATKALFQKVDTPAAMVALGEAALSEAIKTIGLYRTKAKNVIALSKALIERHGGEVPPDREALEALPGVGTKDGERRLERRLR